MKRMLVAGLVAVFAAGAGRAHFAFLVPEPDGATAKLVFSDELAPDPNVAIEKLANTKLFVRGEGGKETPVEGKKGEHCYVVPVAGRGTKVVYGVTEYGVLQKGDAKPFRLTYYPKALVGGGAIGMAPVGGPLAVEIAVVGAAGKARFQVLHNGKAAADAETTVLVPGGARKALKTDKDGLTPEFAETGRYGVFARVTDAKAGEFAGKAYSEARHYATLVVDVK